MNNRRRRLFVWSVEHEVKKKWAKLHSVMINYVLVDTFVHKQTMVFVYLSKILIFYNDMMI